MLLIRVADIRIDFGARGTSAHLHASEAPWLWTVTPYDGDPAPGSFPTVSVRLLLPPSASATLPVKDIDRHRATETDRR